MHGERIVRIVSLLLLPGVLFAADGSPDRPSPFAAFETWLRFERHLPGQRNGSPPGEFSIAYIPGGPQDSIERAIGVAARLYRSGRVGKVLLLHRSGITEYSPALGRNYRNDEWAAERLRKEGVRREDVEFLAIPQAVFGTLAEAREVSTLVRSRGVKRLVLVCSAHHTRRAWISFSHFDAGRRAALYCYGAGGSAPVSELLKEAVKLLLYRFFVLPLDGTWQAISRYLPGGRSFLAPASIRR